MLKETENEKKIIRGRAVRIYCRKQYECVKHKIDDDAGDKSVLYVTNYNGGFGKEWIAEVEKRFEAKYENESFETGKTGVDIRVLNEHDGGSTYLDKVDATYVVGIKLERK